MARANPTMALRPFLPTDAPLLAQIVRAAVEELTGDDYTAAQQEAWIASAADETAFGDHLTSLLTLIGTLESSPVGFIALKDNQKIEMLYVHPAVAGQGVGTMLLNAAERIATARGSKKLTTDASDTARSFFERRGYSAQRRNTVIRSGEWLGNTTMDKPLVAAGESA